jgi:hypothetical protein
MSQLSNLIGPLEKEGGLGKSLLVEGTAGNGVLGPVWTCYSSTSTDGVDTLLIEEVARVRDAIVQ